MKLVELSVKDFIEIVDSNSATPGGGSVSALAVGQGIGLIRMVAHLTTNKKKFLSLEQRVQDEYISSFQQLLQLKIRVIELIDEDTNAFNQIINAFKLPKDTEGQIMMRNQAIKNATIGATKIPFEVASIALQALKITRGMVAYANKNAISDLGVGSLMIASGLEGAVLNVKTNMLGYEDSDMVSLYDRQCDEILNESSQIRNEILDFVHKSLNLKQ